MVRRPRTRVREYVKRDGTEVREHERALSDTDRRDHILDRIRLDASYRRRIEDEAVDEALATYLEEREDGASHEDALERALDTLSDELSGADIDVDRGTFERLKGELLAHIADAKKLGMREADSRATGLGAAIGNSVREREEEDEERMLSIGDALREDDEIFSLQEVADDPGADQDAEDGRVSPLDYATEGVNELGSFVRGQAEKRRQARAAREASQREVAAFAEKAAAERRRETADREGEATGPIKSYPSDQGAPTGTSVSTARRRPQPPPRRVIRGRLDE